MRGDRQPGAVRLLDQEAQVVVGELWRAHVGAGRVHAAAGHHLDDVDTARHPLAHRGDDVLGGRDLATEVVAVPSGAGDRRPGRDDPRQPVVVGPLPVAPVDHVEAAVPEVPDGGHSRGEVPGQRLGDHGVQLVGGEARHPVEGHRPAVGDEVDVHVDEAGEHGGRAVVGHRAAVGDDVRRGLHADDRRPVDEDGGTSLDEPLAVEGELRADRVHLSMETRLGPGSNQHLP